MKINFLFALMILILSSTLHASPNNEHLGARLSLDEYSSKLADNYNHVLDECNILGDIMKGTNLQDNSWRRKFIAQVNILKNYCIVGKSLKGPLPEVSVERRYNAAMDNMIYAMNMMSKAMKDKNGDEATDGANHILSSVRILEGIHQEALALSEHHDNTMSQPPSSNLVAADSHEVVIRKLDHPNDWPFTVDEGILRKDKDIMTFTANGVTYPVNGLAWGMMKTKLEDIWIKDPRLGGQGRKSIGWVLDLGNTLEKN